MCGQAQDLPPTVRQAGQDLPLQWAGTRPTPTVGRHKTYPYSGQAQDLPLQWAGTRPTPTVGRHKTCPYSGQAQDLPLQWAGTRPTPTVGRHKTCLYSGQAQDLPLLILWLKQWNAKPQSRVHRIFAHGIQSTAETWLMPTMFPSVCSSCQEKLIGCMTTVITRPLDSITDCGLCITPLMPRNRM